MMSSIKSRSRNLLAFFDPGSNLSMITYAAARKLDLKGLDVYMTLTKVGNQTKNIESKIYKVPLFDEDGNEWVIYTVGFDEITSEICEVNMSEIALVLGVSPHQIQRPGGKVDLLFGSDYCSLLPRVITVGDLQLMRGPFGLCVSEYLAAENPDSAKLNATENHVRCLQLDDYMIEPRCNVKKLLESFFRIEELGISCFPQFGACHCGKCSLSGSLTLKEEREVKLIEDGLKYDKNSRNWVSEYPWIRNTSQLLNNYSLAYARLQSTEKHYISLAKSILGGIANKCRKIFFFIYLP